MSRLAVEFLDQGLHRVLFNAMPMPVFLVDNDVSILDYNTAAAVLLKKEKKEIVGQRGGAVLDCSHAHESALGCGHAAACVDCVVRNSVRAASENHAVSRQAAQMDLVRRGKQTRVDIRVSCQPVSYGRQSYYLLVLEGLND